MKRMMYVLCAAAQLWVCGAWGQDTDDEGAVLAFTEDTYNFGTIKEADGAVSHTFVAKNTGTAPLVITRVVPSCGCTSPEWTKEAIAPDAEGEVKVTFNPAGRPGKFAKTVSVYSNGKRGGYVLLIRGEVQ